MTTNTRTLLRRLIISYWPAEGFTVSLTTGHNRFLDSEVIAFVPTPSDDEAEYHAARAKVAAILKALRAYTPRAAADSVDVPDTYHDDMI